MDHKIQSSEMADQPTTIIQAATSVQIKTRPRMTVLQSVYHQSPGDQPTQTESKFTRFLATDEQPYIRKMTVGPEWKPIDSGWLEEAGQLIIANEEGRFQQVQPTAAEREEMLSRVVELGFEDGEARGRTMLSEARSPILPRFVIRPGESMRGEPATLKSMRLRCFHGQAKVTVTIFPK